MPSRINRSLSLLAVGYSLCLLCQSAFADDQIRDVQSALKQEGFYYGEINGENTQETSAAIRRYQIRNGLQVTGALNQETADALFKSKAPSAEPSAPAPQSPAHNLEPSPPLQQPEDLRAPQPRPESPNSEVVLIPFAQLFRHTPFEHAPHPVQIQTFQRVQEKLVEKGFYRGRQYSEPSEFLQRAISSYQEARGLRVTGYLDMDTLHELRMLPGESGSPFGSSHERAPRKIYRGIEVR